MNDIPDGATHMRRPEYLMAWLFDGVATMPLWLIERYHSQPLPEHRKGLYALAVDGEFWRWMDVAKFDELYTSVPAQGALDSKVMEFETSVDLSEAIKSVASLYAKSVPAQGAPWQPIETAPKDGTHFLAIYGVDNDDTYWVVFWNGKFFECVSGGYEVEHATHWMPLPAFTSTPGQAIEKTDGGAK